MANEKWGAGVANKLKNKNNLKGTAQEGKEGKEKGKRKRKRKRKSKGNRIIRFPQIYPIGSQQEWLMKNGGREWLIN